MSHSIRLSDEAFRAYEQRARRVGLSVEEYLDQCAPGEDGFVLSPEMRDGIERGLAQADAGRLVGLSEVRESLARYRTEWRENNSR